MASIITIAGEKLFAAKAQANEQLDIDTFIFANVPGQDATAPINREEGLPNDYIVHQQIVQQVGRINDNVVVYSTVLDSVTGPFEFNWVGLYSSVNNTLVAINHIPTTPKTVTADGVAGNTLNRNFGIEYSGIADLTGIDVAPETWQLDFTARLQGMDKLTQQLAADMNGKDWFIGDGFKVEPRETANSFRILPGVGYVSGLRVELENEHIFTVESYPQFIFVDAWFEGSANSNWAPKLSFTLSNTEIDDYTDAAGVKHYVNKLAEVTAFDTVLDLRPDSESANKSWVHDTTFIRRSSYVQAAADASRSRFNDGCVVETLGYYNAYDGGGCRYEVINNALSRIPEGPVTYKQFGAKGAASEDAIGAIIDAHNYANSYNLPVQGDGDKYLISGPGCIDVKTDTNLGGSEFVLSRTGSAEWIKISPSIGKEEKDISQELLNNMRPHLVRGKTFIPDLGNEHEALQSYVHIKTDHVLANRVGYGYSVVAQDSFVLLRDGNIIGQLISDLNIGNVTSATYKQLENSTLTFENFTIFLNFETQAVPQFVIERNQVDIKEFSVKRVAKDLITTTGVGQLFVFNKCYKVKVDTVDGDSIGFGYYGAGAYGYLINCENVVDLTLERLQGNGGWGITGSNWIKDVNIYNSQINRWDVHFGMGNVTIKDTELYGYGVNVTYGDGQLLLENVKLYPQYSKGTDGVEKSYMSGWLVGAGNSYGHWYRGSIIIKDVEIWLDPEGEGVFRIIYAPSLNKEYSEGGAIFLGTQYKIKGVRIKYINEKPSNEKVFSIYAVMIGGDYSKQFRMPGLIDIEDVEIDTTHENTYLRGFIFIHNIDWSDPDVVIPSNCEIRIKNVRNKMSDWNLMATPEFTGPETIQKYSLVKFSLGDAYGNSTMESSVCDFDVYINHCRGVFYDAYYNHKLTIKNSVILHPRTSNEPGGIRRIADCEIWPGKNHDLELIVLVGEWITTNNVIRRSKREGFAELGKINKIGFKCSNGNLVEKGGSFDDESINMLWLNQSPNNMYEVPSNAVPIEALE